VDVSDFRSLISERHSLIDQSLESHHTHTHTHSRSIPASSPTRAVNAG